MKELIRKAAKTWRLVFPLVIVIIIAGCDEDPGLVGAELISNEDNFTFDTVFVTDIEQVQSKAYTGILPNAAIGSYSDALYGDLTARSILRPSIVQVQGLDNIELGAEMQLKVFFDSSNVYGRKLDQLQNLSFNIVSAENSWRARQWFNDTEIQLDQTDVLATFDWAGQDSLLVDLPLRWVGRFSGFYNNDDDNRDSLYRADFPGFAIEPNFNQTGSIIYLDLGRSSFLVNSIGDTTSTGLNIEEWAYTIERTNQPPTPSDRLVIHSTNELLIKTSFFEQLREYENKNILKAELVLYEDTESLNATLGPDEGRGRVPVLESHFGTRLDKPFDFTFGTGDTLGRKRDQENTFRFNITRYVNQFLFAEPESEEFYISIDAGDGIFNSTTVFGPSAEEAKRPKILLTIIEE